ncbi:MAG: hypothetical protein LBO09_03925 [Candidatus Peribacteria bacterium]|jgi:hypothetical protein|nr:hypothetical protein [Candidatus Peribacteria bacterium]
MATSFENEGNAKLATLLTHLNGKTVPYKLYEEMYRCIDFISSKTKFFLQNTPTCIATPPKKKRKPTLKGLSYEEAYQQRKVEEEREWEENKKRDKERKQEREKLTRYNPEILSQLPPEIQKTYRSLRQKLEEIRPKILQKILQYWAQQNFAGRIKRIMEEVLQKKF